MQEKEYFMSMINNIIPISIALAPLPIAPKEAAPKDSAPKETGQRNLGAIRKTTVMQRRVSVSDRLEDLQLEDEKIQGE